MNTVSNMDRQTSVFSSLTCMCCGWWLWRFAGRSEVLSPFAMLWSRFIPFFLTCRLEDHLDSTLFQHPCTNEGMAVRQTESYTTGSVVTEPDTAANTRTSYGGLSLWSIQGRISPRFTNCGYGDSSYFKFQAMSGQQSSPNPTLTLFALFLFFSFFFLF